MLKEKVVQVIQVIQVIQERGGLEVLRTQSNSCLLTKDSRIQQSCPAMGISSQIPDILKNFS